MEKVIIIGANEFQRELVLTSKRAGYETHVFAWEEGAVAKADADFFYPISIVEKDEILKHALEIRPVGIASIGSDLATLTVNYIADKLGLVGNSLHCTEISTNKLMMRNAFKEHGVPSAGYWDADLFDADSEDISFPLIVKPVDRSGSRGVTLVHDDTQLKEAVTRAKGESFSQKVIIEEYLIGKEYSVEYISYRGRHTFLQLTEKFTTEAPHFIETGHCEPAEVPEEMLENIKKIVENALDSLEIKNGASHTEIRIDGENIRVIEVGARMGGDCIGSDLVKLSTGYDYVKMVLDIACGKEPVMQKVCEPRKAYIRFIMNREDYEEYLQKKGELNIVSDMVSSDIDGHYVTDSSTRYGYYIYTE